MKQKHFPYGEVIPQCGIERLVIQMTSLQFGLKTELRAGRT